MKSVSLAAVVALARTVVSTEQVSSPVAKVLSMLSDLQAKTISDGELSQKEYAEFAEWCEDRSRNLGFEIKTGKAQIDTLKGTIAKEASSIASLTTKVEALVADLHTDQADLKAATEIRQKEKAAFLATDNNLAETVDMLGRATIIVEREMKGGASMMQLQSARNLEQAFGVLVQGALIHSADAGKLSAFIQAMQQQEDSDMGAPAGAVYESHSGDILSTLQGLHEKAQGQLDDARKTETADTHSFEMLKQSLEDEISYGQKELAEAKKGIAARSQNKAQAEGDLAVTTKELVEDVNAKASLHHDCMTKAENFEAETKSRGEELAALAKAKHIITEATSGALAQVSLLQLSRSMSSSRAESVILESVRFVRDLARKEKSSKLAQLAARMTSATHTSSGGQFEKIKGLIRDMISKLEGQADADASRKAWCDRNLADANQQKSDKTHEISKLSSRINLMSARSTQLKSEVAALQGELAKLAKSQVQMDKLRQEEKASYGKRRADLEKGLEGLKFALKILSDYYATDDKAHDSADGTATGIISLLEVCESDFTRDLAQVISDEEVAVADYEQVSKQNEIETSAKLQDIHYKTKETKSLDADAAELASDRSNVQEELDATHQTLVRLEEQCIDKAETYAERKARHQAEIAGLREALDILESEAALLQRSARRKLRGGHSIELH